MLASTVQFSNYGQSHVHFAAHTKPNRKTHRSVPYDGIAVHSRRNPHHQHEASHGGSVAEVPSTPTGGRLILQDPTARLDHSPTTPTVPAVTPTPHTRRNVKRLY